MIHGGPSQYLAEPLRRKDLEKEGFHVYEVKAPGGSARPPESPANGAGFGPWSAEFSLDGGKTWKAGLKDLKLGPKESDWGGGHHAYVWAGMDFAENNDAKSVLIRFGQGNLVHAQVFATCESKTTSGVDVTHGWTEDGEAKQDTHRIAAGKNADVWTVPTGQKVKTTWVKFEAK